ncbi:single-stranded DNA-binding protein [Kitasatospora cineracea]|uniref:Single-stranded DNA-binding protein n=1 Tax=Kitasatospora cineracea TaxID=88074 RepID=A0A8G1UKN2_9ACTN|nr:single-stranded DNA-binding protein [Kitasatospora cineracea]ROR44744.1 single-strand DNA-binding protein [Kitasatospora cineracea]
MAGETKITIVGNLADNPTLKYSDSGAARATFTVISNERVWDSSTRNYRDGDSISMPCVAWRQYAENIAASLAKGSRVVVTGVLKQRTHQPADGPRQVYTELQIDEVGACLRFATVEVTKAGSRPAQQGAATAPPATGAFEATWPPVQVPPAPAVPPTVGSWPTPAMVG